MTMTATPATQSASKRRGAQLAGTLSDLVNNPPEDGTQPLEELLPRLSWDEDEDGEIECTLFLGGGFLTVRNHVVNTLNKTHRDHVPGLHAALVELVEACC